VIKRAARSGEVDERATRHTIWPKEPAGRECSNPSPSPRDSNLGSPLPAAGEGLGVRGNFMSNQNRQRARDLRRRQTEHGPVGWRSLRNRRFADFKFRRQVSLGN
jgi:hypothetical protein